MGIRLFYRGGGMRGSEQTFALRTTPTAQGRVLTRPRVHTVRPLRRLFFPAFRGIL